MAAIWAVLGFLGVLLVAALGDLVSEEIRGWLDLIPRGILRLAAVQLDQAQRETIYQDEWLPELQFALRGAESRPITRLILGTRYALGLLIAARRVSQHVDRDRLAVPTSHEVALAPAAVLKFDLADVSVRFTNTSGKAVSIGHQDSAGISIANGNSFEGWLSSAELRRLRKLGLIVERGDWPM